MPAAEFAPARGELTDQRDVLVARERQTAADAPLAAAQLVSEWDLLPVSTRCESLLRLANRIVVQPCTTDQRRDRPTEVTS